MRLCATLTALLLAGACGPAPARPPGPAQAPAPTASGESPAEDFVVLVLGDSLAAGYGLPAELAFPSLVEEGLRREGRCVRVVNAGVSGDTTAGGLRRLDWVLKANEPDLVLVELGGNDGLRGLSLEDTEANLRAIVEGARGAGAEVLLAGMLIPPNYGPEYAGGFARIYPRLAESDQVPLIPFLLEGVAADPALNLPDGIHPNAEGQRIVAATVLEHLRPLVSEAPQDC